MYKRGHKLFSDHIFVCVVMEHFGNATAKKWRYRGSGQMVCQNFQARWIPFRTGLSTMVSFLHVDVGTMYDLLRLHRKESTCSSPR
jgi:hypothetical protein